MIRLGQITISSLIIKGRRLDFFRYASLKIRVCLVSSGYELHEEVVTASTKIVVCVFSLGEVSAELNLVSAGCECGGECGGAIRNERN